MTMQQYNSWNGIVWRNDPDHCDVFPRFKPAEAGNVSKTSTVTAAPADTVIRPALASIAGGLLMLSDRPAVYRDDANLRGLRRSAPSSSACPAALTSTPPRPATSPAWSAPTSPAAPDLPRRRRPVRPGLPGGSTSSTGPFEH
ncbi:MAG: hypothetical protein U1G05_12810 [Kiritimatiellia bacterium]